MKSIIVTVTMTFFLSLLSFDTPLFASGTEKSSAGSGSGAQDRRARMRSEKRQAKREALREARRKKKRKKNTQAASSSSQSSKKKTNDVALKKIGSNALSVAPNEAKESDTIVETSGAIDSK